jgi:hypothetical protein
VAQFDPALVGMLYLVGQEPPAAQARSKAN